VNLGDDSQSDEKSPRSIQDLGIRREDQTLGNIREQRKNSHTLRRKMDWRHVVAVEAAS
jgi:hypothetical protein